MTCIMSKCHMVEWWPIGMCASVCVCVCVCVCVHTHVCMYVHFKHPQYSWQKSNYRDAELHEVVHRFNQGARYLQNAFSWYLLKCNLSTPVRKTWPALHWFSWKWNMISSIMCTILLQNFTHIRGYKYIFWMCHSTAWLLMNIIITPLVFIYSSCAIYYPDWIKNT
jgi:hypothetical protein